MLYSAEIKELLTPAEVSESTSEIKAEENGGSKSKKKKKNKLGFEEIDIPPNFVPTDKHKFYVPPPRSTQGKRWVSDCKPLSQFYWLNLVEKCTLMKAVEHCQLNSSFDLDDYDNDMSK